MTLKDKLKMIDREAYERRKLLNAILCKYYEPFLLGNYNNKHPSWDSLEALVPGIIRPTS